MAFVVLYDACVLYPAPLRDLLLRLSAKGLVQARWSDQILDEAFRSILGNRPELRASHLQRTRDLMNKAIPGALVTGYEGLVAGLALPDQDDCHVLAAAIRAGAQVIVTANLSDFPADKITPYGGLGCVRASRTSCITWYATHTARASAPPCSTTRSRKAWRPSSSATCRRGSTVGSLSPRGKRLARRDRAAAAAHGVAQGVGLQASRRPTLVAHKVGVYVVERAMQQSGLTAAQLVMMPTEQVLALAKAATSP